MSKIRVFYHNQKKQTVLRKYKNYFSEKGDIWILCKDSRSSDCECKKCYRIEFNEDEFDTLFQKECVK